MLTMAATRHQLTIGAAAIPDIHDCFNLLLPTAFLAHMLEAMNRGQKTGPITPAHATTFMNGVLNVHLYRCSPETLFAELGHGASSLYGQHPELHGAEVIFKRCLDGLSFAPNSEHRGIEWSESQSFDPTIHDAAKCKSCLIRVCMRLLHHLRNHKFTNVIVYFYFKNIQHRISYSSDLDI